MEDINPIQEIAALAAYKPRQAAIQMIIDGRIEDYLAWAHGNSHLDEWVAALETEPLIPSETEAFPVDSVLLERISDSIQKKAPGRLLKIGKLQDEAFKTIPYFNASPLEIALRSGSMDSLEAMLRRLSDPQQRFAEGRYGTRNGGWTSLFPRSLALHIDDYEKLALLEWAGTFSEPRPLVVLACLLGNFEAAALLQRHGWAPDNEFAYADLSAPLYQSAEALIQVPQQEDMVTRIFDIPKGTINQAAEWLWNRGEMATKLEELFGTKDYQGIRDEAVALLDKGAPVSGYALAIATEHNDLEMLRLLFDAGGDPNAVYKNGWSFLARLNSKKLSAEALQIWLDRGASPINHMDADSPFGLSALAEWSWEGRLDLIRQAVDQAAGPVPLTYQREVQKEDDSPEVKQTFSPILATALSKERFELAVWLLREKGLSLDDWDDWEEGEWEPCHTFASPEFLAKVKSAIAQ